MSRTYRRKKDRKGRNSEAGFWTMRPNSQWWEDAWWLEWKYNGDKERARAKYYGDNHSGYYSPPSWHYRLFMTVPERRKTKQALHKVLRLIDYEDCPLFPLDKKPKEYYW